MSMGQVERIVTYRPRNLGAVPVHIDVDDVHCILRVYRAAWDAVAMAVSTVAVVVFMRTVRGAVQNSPRYGIHGPGAKPHEKASHRTAVCQAGDAARG